MTFGTGWVASCGVKIFVVYRRGWKSGVSASGAICVERTCAKFAIRMAGRALVVQWNCAVVPVASRTVDTTLGLE